MNVNKDKFRRSSLAAAALIALAQPAIAATYTWNVGNLTAANLPATLNAADTLAIGVGNYKYVNTGLTNQGTVSWQDSLYFQNGNTISNSGTWTAVGNAALADGGYGGAFTNSGSFSAAGNTVTISGVTFTNSGVLNADVGGAINYNSGNAAFNAGTQFTGAGVNAVNSNASFNGAFSSQNLLLAAGIYTGTGAQINGLVNWQTGSLTGSWQVNAAQGLTLNAGNYHYLNGTLNNLGTINAADTLYFQNGSTLTNQGSFNILSAMNLADGGYSGNFVNQGLLRNYSGAAANVNGVAFVNAAGAVIDVGAGSSLSFNSNNATFNAGTQFNGAGQIVVNSDAAFNGSFNAANLQLAAGTYTGTGAQINGSVTWTTGVLAGDWTLNAGQSLALAAGNYHYLNASLNNKGTISAQDTLYLRSGNTLTNQSLYDMQGDVNLADGGYSGNFVNNGILRKSAGAGTSAVGGVAFINNGEINAATGTINFNGTAPIFNNGSTFTGAGQVTVNTNASFVGGFTTASNLTLGSGTFTGGDGSSGNATSLATINGNVAWLTGTLAGAWELAAGQTLSLVPGNYHNLNGSLNNKGAMSAQDSLYFMNGNTLTNQNLYDMQGDVGLVDGGYNGNFLNNGIFRKSAGAGTSAVGGVAFVNNGEINAATGTINFNGTAPVFNNGSKFTGAGQITVNTNASFVGGFTTANNLTLGSGTFTGGNGSAGSQAVINGNTQWTTGTMAGNWTVASGNTLTLQTGNYHYLNGTLTNSGTIAAQDTLYLLNGNTLANKGTYQLQGDVGVSDGGYNGNFVNTGLLVKTGGTGTSDLSAINVSNTGVIDVQVGTVRLPANFTNNGVLKGNGSFAVSGTLTNDGTVAPGASPGTLNLNGNYMQTAGGALAIELQSVASHDLFKVSGTTSLSGTLALSCFGACNYTVGDSILVLDSVGALTGTFSAVTLAGFATGAFNVVYDSVNNDVLLQVTQPITAAVPEPESWALMLGGLAAMGWLAKRRQS